jgi:hypothetical protein
MTANPFDALNTCSLTFCKLKQLCEYTLLSNSPPITLIGLLYLQVPRLRPLVIMSNITVKRSKEQRWKVIERGQPKCSEKKLSQCHFVHYNSHINTRTLWEAGDYVPDIWSRTEEHVITEYKVYCSEGSQTESARSSSKGWPKTKVEHLVMNKAACWGKDCWEYLAKKEVEHLGWVLCLEERILLRFRLIKFIYLCTQRASLYRGGKCK